MEKREALKQLYVYDAEKGISMNAYTDLIVWDEGTENVQMISLLGFANSIKGITAGMLKGKMLSFYGYPHHLRTNKEYRFFSGKIGDGTYSQSIVVSAAAFEIEQNKRSKLTPLILAWGGNKIEALYTTLVQNYTIPLKAEWTTWLWNELNKHGHIRSMSVWSARPGVLEAFTLSLSDDELRDIITTAVKDGRLRIGNGKVGRRFREAVSSMDQYLISFGNDLAQKIKGKFKPLHAVGSPRDPIIDTLREPLFGPQADVVEGLARALDVEDTAVLVGEMGTGKGRMLPSIAYRHSKGKPFRCICQVPPHLVKKWKREVEAIIPSAKVTVIQNYKDAFALRKLPKKPTGYEYFIISTSTSKLGYNLKPAVKYQEKVTSGGRIYRKGFYCPDCGKRLERIDETPWDENSFDSRKMSNDKCPYCGARLWRPENPNMGIFGFSEDRRFRVLPVDSENRRGKVAAMTVLGKYFKRFFDYALVDEIHELAGRSSAQGNTLSVLGNIAKKMVVGTGTLSGGYASNVFYLLFRMAPDKMREDGYNYNSVQRFIDTYGVVERVFKTDNDSSLHSSSKGSNKRCSVRERPGISPVLFAKYFMHNSAFIEMSDMSDVLPVYLEEVIMVDMDPELKEAYEHLEDRIAAFMKEHWFDKGPSNSRRILGTQLHTLLSYPDKPFGNDPLIHPVTGELIAEPTELSTDTLYAKEKVLLDYVQREVRELNRWVYVYVNYSNTKDIQPRLASLLAERGFRVKIMYSGKPQSVYGERVTSSDREEWINRQVAAGTEVIISNRKLVATGLDLLWYPSIFNYQTGYSLTDLRQGAKRAYRLNQTQACRTTFCAYRESLQNEALVLMGQKLCAAESLEGKFSSEGLHQLAEGYDVASELAKRVMNGLDKKTSAEAIWRKMAKGVDMSSFPKRRELAVKPTSVESLDYDLFSDLVSGSGAPTPLATVTEEPVPIPVAASESEPFAGLAVRIVVTDYKNTKSKKKKSVCDGQLGFDFMAA